MIDKLSNQIFALLNKFFLYVYIKVGFNMEIDIYT
jgi:hypothetical protein